MILHINNFQVGKSKKAYKTGHLISVKNAQKGAFYTINSTKTDLNAENIMEKLNSDFCRNANRYGKP